jgi:hypothetical protein
LFCFVFFIFYYSFNRRCVLLYSNVIFFSLFHWITFLSCV